MAGRCRCRPLRPARSRCDRRPAPAGRAVPGPTPRPGIAAAAGDRPGRARRIRWRRGGARRSSRPVRRARRRTSLLTRPSRIATVRLTWSLTSGSWVTTTIVTPSSRFTSRSRSKISWAVAVSSSPVGSSARSTAGWFASATAIATRCCSPPDSRSGRWSARSANPTRRSNSRACPSRASEATPLSTIGSITFSSADRYGSRLRPVCCQTNPITRRR